MLKRKCQEEGDVPKTIEILKNSSGIEIADKLSIDHIYQSLDNLESIVIPDLKNSTKLRNIINIEKDPFA